MAECQICGSAVIVPRPFKTDNDTWVLACNRCIRNKNPMVFVGTK